MDSGDGVQGPYVSVGTPQEQHQQHQQPALLTPNHLHSLAQKWYAIRWQLARTVFARPVPFLTNTLKLKLGDLLVTLPVAAAFLAINAVALANGDVGGGGSPAAIVMVIVFALAVRNNSILLLATGIPFDRAIFYHKFFGGVAWIVSGLHGLAYLLSDDSGSDSGELARRGRRLRHEGEEDGAFPRQLSGALTFYALSALVVFAFEPIRRRFFDFFQRFHWLFIVLIVVFGVIHGAAIILIGFVPYLLDMAYRYGYRSRLFAREGGGIHANQVTLKLVAKDIVRVQFPRPPVSPDGPNFRYEAGQYAFLCIPAISALEWHPFTIASAPHESHVTFFIKSSGDWTKQLAAFVAQCKSDEPVAVLVDGPYGAVAIEMDHYSHFVFVSGGIGVTPMLSLANDLHYAAKSRRTPVQKAWFVWAVRDREMVEAILLDGAAHVPHTTPSWLPHVLSSPSNANSLTHDAFYADVYLTNNTQDLSEAVDQQLALCLKHSERPDIAQILRQVGESALAANSSSSGSREPVRVAVLVCGPAAMVSGVVAQSQMLTKSIGVVFDVHQETFAW